MYESFPGPLRGVASAIVSICLLLMAAMSAAADDARPIERIPAPYNEALQGVVEGLPERIFEGEAGNPVNGTPNERAMKVYSPSMRRFVGLHILLPADRSKPAPIIYTLNGAGGGEDAAAWQISTDIREFYSDKQVYVVTLMGGALTYYTDWIHYDEKLGIQKWETFLGEELPAVLEGPDRKLAMATTGRRALVGMSMSATSSIVQATMHPGLYDFVSAYSGCPQTNDPVGTNSIGMVTAAGVLGGNIDDVNNMWGPPGSPEWVNHDPIRNATRHVGKKTFFYVYSGTGLPGPHDVPDSPFMQGDGDDQQLLNQMIVGGALEAVSGLCSYNLQQRYTELKIPSHFKISLKGTHSWGYWQDAMHEAWPFMATALKV